MASQLSSPPIITLTTDFGLSDEFVGTMKGVMLSICRQAHLVDITHAIPPQDIGTASEIINKAYSYFPDNSYHLVIVDPGVGSSRALLALKTAKHTFVAPDNGVLSHLLSPEKFQEAYRIENERLLLPHTSHTFHGRDIMAPVIARLAGGMELPSVGPAIDRRDCIQLQAPGIIAGEGTITGEVTGFDHFGNIQTSISSNDIEQLGDASTLTTTLGSHLIGGLSRTYSDTNKGELLALLNSSNQLEIAVNCGNALIFTQVELGTQIIVSTSPSPLP